MWVCRENEDLTMAHKKKKGRKQKHSREAIETMKRQYHQIYDNSILKKKRD